MYQYVIAAKVNTQRKERRIQFCRGEKEEEKEEKKEFLRK